ncbi:MAG: alcohol dehydrogenase catalytic domain-containing protein [Deltaproteobacteria bacterium]|nr:alcohol dehydrogenase catalytic domain-containing protein [Deltaproteobacteria bacterium]
MQGMMKAARLYGFEKTHGSKDLIRVDEVAIPDIGPGEVLIRVLRAGLNHGDLHIREDALQYEPENTTVPVLPMIVGHDGLGEVVEVGPNVINVKPGDRAVVMCSITCGFCKYCRSDRQHLCVMHRVMGFVARWREGGLDQLLRYKDGLWAEYCRVPATNLIKIRPDDDIDQICKVSQMTVGYRALKRARLHSGETVIVNGATGITGIGTVMSALAMGAAHIIAVARNPVRLEQIRAINPQRISTIGQGESITQKIQELTQGQGGSVLADLTPGGAETTVECIKSLEPGGRVTLIGANPEPLNLPLRYLMIRSIEFTSVTGRHYTDFPEVFELARRGVIDTKHVTTRFFPIEAINEALDHIEKRGDNDPLWPMYAPGKA